MHSSSSSSPDALSWSEKEPLHPAVEEGLLVLGRVDMACLEMEMELGGVSGAFSCEPEPPSLWEGDPLSGGV